MASSSKDNDILEGFLCPICKADLKSATQLTNHFESLHSEDQDLLGSLKEIFGIAKKIILNTNEDRVFDRSLTFTDADGVVMIHTEQTIGPSRSSTDYFKGVRSARLERYAAETNKLLIRLDKLLCNMPTDKNQRKQHEQHIVPWIDESLVKLCPNCAKSFNITRRKHHCRLCGSIMCHDCSLFLDINVAKSIIDPSVPLQSVQIDTELLEKTGLRLCEHCHNLIDLRRQVQENKNIKSSLLTSYEQLIGLIEQARPAVEMYEKMCQSLFDGETTYNLSDVNAMRGRIGKLAEGIDMLSKRIVALPAEPGSRLLKLHGSIRQAASYFIKEDLLSLRKLPTESQIEEVRQQRFKMAERQIEIERLNMERVMAREREPMAESSNVNDDEDNLLLEQMNIVRNYIKEARSELRFDEVASLEANLKDLKKEFQFQQLSKKTYNS